MGTNIETNGKQDRDRIINRVLDHPFFSGMGLEQKAGIAASVEPDAVREAVFRANEIVFREGEPADRFYLIESGSIMLEAHEPADGTFPIQKLEAGDELGFSWLFPPFAWCLQARCLETSRVLVLNAAHLLIAAEQNKVFGYELMKKVGQLAINRLQAIQKQFIAKSKALGQIEKTGTL
jgi:CRP-like cAMP-binding protein